MTAHRAGRHRLQLHYDPLGRRVVKTIATSAAPLWGSATWNAFTWTAAATTATTYLHDGSSEIAEYDGAGALVRRFVPGPSVDEFIAMVTAGGTKTFVHVNRQGSVIATADTSGAPAEGPYTYDAYGNCFTSAGASCTTLAATTVPFRYTGQRYDPETNLYYYKARYYCVTFGRFCETDPIGYGPDVNWYTAFGNDPTDKTDPTGMIDNSHGAPTYAPLTPEQQRSVDNAIEEGIYGSPAAIVAGVAVLTGAAVGAAAVAVVVNSGTVAGTTSAAARLINALSGDPEPLPEFEPPPPPPIVRPGGVAPPRPPAPPSGGSTGPQKGLSDAVPQSPTNQPVPSPKEIEKPPSNIFRRSPL